MKLGAVRLVATSLAVATVVLLLVLSPGGPERTPVAKSVEPPGFEDLLRSPSLGLVETGGSLGDLYASSCGVVRLSRHERVPQPFRGCLARAIRDSQSAQLTVLHTIDGVTTTSAYRSVATQTGLLVGQGTRADDGVTTWVVRDCPGARAVGNLGPCTRVGLD
ncbi:MAG: hypothetical protein ABJA86_08505 [Nocardioidaceae bacterium]